MAIGGITWSQTSLPYGQWNWIASDSTGQYLAAVQGVGRGPVYISTTG